MRRSHVWVYRAALLVVVALALAVAVGCFSSPAPSQVPQLPQQPPLVVTQYLPAPVPAWIRELADRMDRVADNTPQGVLMGKAATAIKTYGEVVDKVQPAPKVEVSPVGPVSPPVEKPPPSEKPGPLGRAKLWYEHALDVVGWVAIAIGIGIIALNIGQALLTPPWWTGLLREAKDALFGVAFIAAGIICIAWPWPMTFVVGGLTVAYVAWRVGKARAGAKP